MLNIKYYKDLNHNFLIVSNKISEKEQNYQYKMINNNKIKHLLNCKIRFVDEMCSFYYEISSKQNLISLFDKKGIGYEQVFGLLENMKEALEELDIFLLDSRCLFLAPEYIFAEPETEEYFFLYYPCMEETEGKKALTSLAEFLVSKVNHEQEEAMEITYRIYEAIQDDRFMLPQILSSFHLPEPDIDSDIDGLKAVNRMPADDLEVIESDDWLEGDYYESAQTDGESVDRESNHHLPVVGVLAVLCAAAAAGIWGINYFFTLSAEEKLVTTAGIMVLVLLSAVLFLYFIINICKRKNSISRDNKKEKATDDNEIEGRVIKRSRFEAMKTEKPHEERKDTGKGGYKEMGDGNTRYGAHIEAAEEYGNTVFLDTSAYKKENKLYGISKGNKYHIDLGNLPCTIGKMAGNVDIVIKDSTISRIHARFTKQENKIYVTDMNSTNGTFKNGLRLEPNETVLIEQGDELRFGRLTFCYR